MSNLFKKPEPAPERPRTDASAATSIIGRGTTFNGVLRVNGSLRVDGEVEGQVFVAQGLVVGPDGVLKVELVVTTATIAGRVVGRVRAKGKVELRKGGRLEGDVHAASFQIEDGAFFQGNCSMGGETPEAGRDAARPETPTERLKVVGPSAS
jgi:cytoskeletal protein CcmA (bactofilin family)